LRAQVLTSSCTSKPGIVTLPLGPWGKTYAVFITGGLQQAASSSALAALLAREIALLRAHYVHLPERWQLLAAIKGPPKRKHPMRRKRSSSSSSSSSSALPWDISAEQVCKLCVELCRLHFGLRWIAKHTCDLPPELREATNGLLTTVGFSSIPQPVGDAMDAVAVASHNGRLAGAKVALYGAKDLEERRQLRQIWRINMLMVDVGFAKAGEFETPAEAKRDLARIYWVGPERVERILQFLARLRHPWRFKQKKAAFMSHHTMPSPQLVLSALLATQRSLELSADRAAAQVVGDFTSVVAGLVEVYGTALDRRRLHRGELLGLIEDAQAEQVSSGKWAIWWRSVVKNNRHPPLQLRIAELAQWAASEPGQSRLSRWRRGRSNQGTNSPS